MTKLRYLVPLLFVAALGSANNAYGDRTASGNTIVSTRDPAVRVRIPASARYVGTDAFTLYGIADCQIFIYAQAGADKVVGRLYWVQFEAYVPSMPKLKHEYDSPQHATLGGLDFYVDSWVESSVPSPHAEGTSDYQHVVAILNRHGYHLPPHMASLRLVHLLDPQTRKELMIIYSVPAESGVANDAGLRQFLLDEARRHIQIAPLGR